MLLQGIEEISFALLRQLAPSVSPQPGTAHAYMVAIAASSHGIILAQQKVQGIPRKPSDATHYSKLHQLHTM